MTDEYLRKNWYKILEVLPDANEEEIKKSYRNLTKKYHPDWHPNASEEELKELNEKTNYIMRAWEFYKKNKDNLMNNYNEPVNNVYCGYKEYKQSKPAEEKKETKTEVDDVLFDLLKIMQDKLKSVIKKGRVNQSLRYKIFKGGLSLSINVIKKINIKRIKYSRFIVIINEMVNIFYEIENSSKYDDIKAQKEMYNNLRKRAFNELKNSFPNFSENQIEHVINRALFMMNAIKDIKKNTKNTENKKRTI